MKASSLGDNKFKGWKLRHNNGRKLQQVFYLNKLVETLNKLVDTLEDVKELSEGIRRISSRLNNRVIDK